MNYNYVQNKIMFINCLLLHLIPFTNKYVSIMMHRQDRMQAYSLKPLVSTATLLLTTVCQQKKTLNIVKQTLRQTKRRTLLRSGHQEFKLAQSTDVNARYFLCVICCTVHNSIPCEFNKCSYFMRVFNVITLETLNKRTLQAYHIDNFQTLQLYTSVCFIKIYSCSVNYGIILAKNK